MRKTALEIEADIFKLVAQSELAQEVRGGVHRQGLRPFNSQEEDVVVGFLTGIDTGFYQKGKININIYVPNSTKQGLSQKNVKRCAYFERLALNFIEKLRATPHYNFKLSRSIQTLEDAAVKQHFVHLQLEFQYNTLI